MKKKVLNTLCILLVFTLFFLMALGSGLEKTVKNIVTGDVTSAEDVTIDEQVLVDQDGVIITATEMVRDSFSGLGLKLLIENNTDQELGFGCNAFIVNNYMFSDNLYSTVSAGKKANEIIYLDSDDLGATSIDIIGQIEVSFNVYVEETYDTLFDTECITIQTSQFASMDAEAIEFGTEILNQDGIRIVAMNVVEGYIMGSGIELYIENTSGKDVSIHCEDLSVNGFMISQYFSIAVYDGKMAVASILISESDLKDNDIESIDEMEFWFQVSDAYSFDTVFDSDPIIITSE